MNQKDSIEMATERYKELYKDVIDLISWIKIQTGLNASEIDRRGADWSDVAGMERVKSGLAEIKNFLK
jgi:hypothetical protein